MITDDGADVIPDAHALADASALRDVPSEPRDPEREWETDHVGTFGVSEGHLDASGRVYLYSHWLRRRAADSVADAYVIRLAADGTLDRTFAENGFSCDGLAEGGGDYSAAIHGMAIDPRGRRVLVGSTLRASRPTASSTPASARAGCTPSRAHARRGP